MLWGEDEIVKRNDEFKCLTSALDSKQKFEAKNKNLGENSMSKRLLKLFSVFTLVFIMVTSSLTSMASDVHNADMDLDGRVTHICDSTLFYYDIEVKLAGTNTYYFVASSDRFEMAVTATSSGFTQLGSPVQETVSGSEASQSANYGNESALSAIAVEYLVTGGPDHSYVYFEEYDEIEYVELH